MNIDLGLETLPQDKLSEFNELIYQYGLKIYIVNSLEDSLAKVRAELVQIEESLINYNTDNFKTETSWKN